MVLLCRFSIRKSSSQNVGQSRAFAGELISLLQKISLSRKRCFGVFKEEIRLLQELPPSSQMAPPKKARFSNFNKIDLHCSKTLDQILCSVCSQKMKTDDGSKIEDQVTIHDAMAISIQHHISRATFDKFPFQTVRSDDESVVVNDRDNQQHEKEVNDSEN